MPIDGTVTIVTDESRPTVGRVDLTFSNADALRDPYQLTIIPHSPKPTGRR